MKYIEYIESHFFMRVLVMFANVVLKKNVINRLMIYKNGKGAGTVHVCAGDARYKFYSIRKSRLVYIINFNLDNG